MGKLQPSSPQLRKEISELRLPFVREVVLTLRSTDKATKLKQALMIFPLKPVLYCLTGLRLVCAKRSPLAVLMYLVPTIAWLTWKCVGSGDAQAVSRRQPCSTPL